MTDELKNIVEAVLLAADGPVSVARIQGLFDEPLRPEASQVHDALDRLKEDCDHRGVELKKIGNGYRFHTREKYADYLRRLHAVKPPKLSRPLLETLAIIAYRQPATRGDIESVRGVSVSTDLIQRLTERGWIKQIGVRDVPGHPALFGTTPEFLSYFNLSSLQDLPALGEQRDLGEVAAEMEIPLSDEMLAALASSGPDSTNTAATGPGVVDPEAPDEEESKEVMDENLPTAGSGHDIGKRKALSLPPY